MSKSAKNVAKGFLLHEGDLVWIEHGPDEYNLAIVERLEQTRQRRGKPASSQPGVFIKGNNHKKPIQSTIIRNSYIAESNQGFDRKRMGVTKKSSSTSR